MLAKLDMLMRSPWLPRLCLLAVVWGVAVFGSASVVRQLVKARLPALEDYLRGYVLGYQQALTDTTALLDDTLADSRLQNALAAEKPDVSALHRVLYEYRYLHPESQLMLYDLVRSQRINVPGGPPVLLDDERLAYLQGHHGLGQWLGGTPANPMLITARPVQSLPGGKRIIGLMARPLGEVFKTLALPPLVGREAGALQPTVALASRVGEQVWSVSPGQAALAEPRLEQANLTQPGLSNNADTVTVVRPLKRAPGWALVVDFPMGVVSALASKLRLIMVLVAAVLTLAALWQPVFRRARAATRSVPAGKLAGAVQGLSSKIQGFTQPLAQAISRASQGEALQEPDLPPPPQAAGGGQAKNAGGGSGGKPRAMRKGGGSTEGGSSVHQRARGSGEYEPDLTPPPPAEPEAPKLPDDEIRALVKRGIEQDLLQLAYQPIFRASDGMPEMHEVFVRLPGPSGELEAHNFLPQAAELGLMPHIDAQVFANVMLAHFRNGGLPLTPLALNLSATTMAGIAYAGELEKITDPRILNHLVFEVRSAELLQDPSAITFLKSCQERGVRLAVDYFGGGKAMLEATKALGFNYVKLNALDFWYDLARRKELVGLARVAAHLHLPIVLEKVEINPMEVMARKVRIPFLQGYHMHKPGAELVTAPLKGPGLGAGPPSGPVQS